MNLPQPNDILELRKDVTTPIGYTRAGKQRSASEWDAIWPGCIGLSWREWFINLSIVEPEKPYDPLRDLVRQVFKEHGLHSLSYMDAACEVVKRYEKAISE
jgi:hypothetical protein